MIFDGAYPSHIIRVETSHFRRRSRIASNRVISIEVEREVRCPCIDECPEATPGPFVIVYRP